MNAIALQSPVLSKPEEEKKGTYTFSLGKDLYQRIKVMAKQEGRSMSSMVERLLRERLGLTGQIDPDDGGDK